MRSESTVASGPRAPNWLRVLAWGGLVFLHFPIVVVCLYAFNTEESAFSFPLQGFTLKWFGLALGREDVRAAIGLSLRIAAMSTVMAMLLGTMAAGALYRRNFFGKEAITLLFILPIALPGIVTGVALLSAYKLARVDPASVQFQTANGRILSPERSKGLIAELGAVTCRFR